MAIAAGLTSQVRLAFVRAVVLVTALTGHGKWFVSPSLVALFTINLLVLPDEFETTLGVVIELYTPPAHRRVAVVA